MKTKEIIKGVILHLVIYIIGLLFFVWGFGDFYPLTGIFLITFSLAIFVWTVLKGYRIYEIILTKQEETK